MVKGNAHFHVCYLVCSPLDIVFSMLEVEVHQKKRNCASNIVAEQQMLTIVSNRDFVIMIARMGFAHGRSVARVDVHGMPLVKCLMCGMGCITPVAKRNCVVWAATPCITMLLGAPTLQCIIQIAKELFNEPKIDNARYDQIHRAHSFGSHCECTCLHVGRQSAYDIVSLQLANEFWELQVERIGQ